MRSTPAAMNAYTRESSAVERDIENSFLSDEANVGSRAASSNHWIPQSYG